jgi:predicted O-methyltransferase YrrM
MNEKTLIELAEKAEKEHVYPNPQFPPSLYYRFLKVLASYMQPNLSVELGVCGGGGSLHLALGWPVGTVVGVDIADDHPSHIKTIQETCPNFHFWQGDSVHVAPEIHNRYGAVDILFIDTTHTYTQTLKEFEAYQPYLSGVAIVCLDDLFRQEMGNIWEDLPGNKLRLDKLHDGAECGGGFGVIWL